MVYLEIPGLVNGCLQKKVWICKQQTYRQDSFLIIIEV